MKSCAAILVVISFLFAAGIAAQQAPAQGAQELFNGNVPVAVAGLPDTPQVLGTGAPRYRVVPIKGLVTPWALAFLPNGDILVTERPGRLRIIRKVYSTRSRSRACLK